MPTNQELLDALHRIEDKNDNAHGAITQKIEKIQVGQVKNETRICAIENKCNRRGAIYVKVLIGVFLSAFGFMMAYLFS